MMEDAILPIREFSRLTGISRETLRFYDKIELLSPEKRGKNSYRFYAARQLDFAYLISELRALGMGLEEIKKYADQRTPERMLTLFREQNAHIEEEIRRLRSIQTAMSLRAEAAEDALRYERDRIVLVERKREPIFLCPFPESGSSEVDASLQAYRYAAEHGINISYPFGVILPKETIETGNRSAPVQYYFKARKEHNAWKRAGTYAVYLYRQGDWPTTDVYRPLLSFLEEKGMRMEGEIYEECPLDEFSVPLWEEYRMQVEVRVAEA